MGFSIEAVDALVDIMRNPLSLSQERRLAAVALLDRACGKPSQPLTDGDGGPLIPATKAAALEALRGVLPAKPPIQAPSPPPAPADTTEG